MGVTSTGLLWGRKSVLFSAKALTLSAGPAHVDTGALYRGKQKRFIALAGVAQWIERGPANQRVAGWIPSQGTCLGCRPGPQ